MQFFLIVKRPEKLFVLEIEIEDLFPKPFDHFKHHILSKLI